MRSLSVQGMQRIYHLRMEEAIPAPPLIDKMFGAGFPYWQWLKCYQSLCIREPWAIWLTWWSPPAETRDTKKNDNEQPVYVRKLNAHFLSFLMWITTYAAAYRAQNIMGRLLRELVLNEKGRDGIASPFPLKSNLASETPYAQYTHLQRYTFWSESKIARLRGSVKICWFSCSALPVTQSVSGKKQ